SGRRRGDPPGPADAARGPGPRLRPGVRAVPRPPAEGRSVRRLGRRLFLRAGSRLSRRVAGDPAYRPRPLLPGRPPLPPPHLGDQGVRLGPPHRRLGRHGPVPQGRSAPLLPGRAPQLFLASSLFATRVSSTVTAAVAASPTASSAHSHGLRCPP